MTPQHPISYALVCATLRLLREARNTTPPPPYGGTCIAGGVAELFAYSVDKSTVQRFGSDVPASPTEERRVNQAPRTPLKSHGKTARTKPVREIPSGTSRAEFARGP